MHRAAAGVGCGQAAPVPGEVWERVSLSEVWVCAGAVAGVCGAAGGFLSGVQGALREYGAVYGEGGGWVGLPSGVGSLCALFEVGGVKVAVGVRKIRTWLT